MIWIFINGRILGRSLLPVHTSLLRVSYCELVRKFMDDVMTLVGDKRHRCRLLRRVLCLVQSSQPSSKNIFRRRAKVEKKKKQKKKTCTLPQCDTEIRYFRFAAFVDHCVRSFCFISFLDVFVWFVQSFLPVRASRKTCYRRKIRCRDYINTFTIITHWRGKVRRGTSHTLPHVDFKESTSVMWIRHKAVRILVCYTH